MLSAKIQLAKHKEFIQNYFVISQTSKWLKGWKALIVACNLVSSYYYMFLCSFKVQELPANTGPDIAFIVIFLLDIGVNFLTEKTVFKDNHEI